MAPTFGVYNYMLEDESAIKMMLTASLEVTNPEYICTCCCCDESAPIDMVLCFGARVMLLRISFKCKELFQLAQYYIKVLLISYVFCRMLQRDFL